MLCAGPCTKCDFSHMDICRESGAGAVRRVGIKSPLLDLFQTERVRIFMEQIKAGDFRVIDNCLMIRLPEEIDHHGAGIICENADRYLVRKEVQNVVFDFEKTRFMDSSGIGIIMGRYRKISCFGGRVYAIHVDRQIERIFRLSGLNKIVEVLES